MAINFDSPEGSKKENYENKECAHSDIEETVDVVTEHIFGSFPPKFHRVKYTSRTCKICGEDLGGGREVLG